MKLIVGLGNPGKEYAKTRHNIGFMSIDHFLGDVTFKEESLASVYMDSKNKIVYIKPKTFMNNSGDAVSHYASFYDMDCQDILVIQDDLDLPLGKLRVKINSSSGGHNGIKDITLKLHSDGYTRLKVGISNQKEMDTKDYVLGKLSNEDLEQVDFSKINDIINAFISGGFDLAKYTCDNI